MTKVRASGIGGTIADWIENWLTGRKQRVVINGKASNWVNVTSGVPQGSVLGPLLFIIYINDLDCNIVSKLVKFADDTKLGNRDDTLDNVSNIQRDLNRIVNWANTWQMTFNSSKCKVLYIGKANLHSDYKMRIIQLRTIDTQNNLGIVISSDLKTTKHCIEVEKKCNPLLGYIKHQFLYRNKKIVVTLYNSLVLPHLQF